MHVSAKHSVALFIIISALVCSSESYAAATTNNNVEAIVGGIKVKITSGEYPKPSTVDVNGKTVIQDQTNRMTIKGTYEGAGKSYVLIEKNSGGNLCPTQLVAIELSDKEPNVSKDFADCDDMLNASASDGVLIIEVTKSDGKGTTTYSFHEGKLTSEDKTISLEPTGASQVPGNNLAAFVMSKKMNEIFLLRATAEPLKKIMPPAAFEVARDFSLGGRYSLFETSGDVAWAMACNPGYCGGNWVRVAFDQQGRAYASIKNEQLDVYGNPSPEIEKILAGEETSNSPASDQPSKNEGSSGLLSCDSPKLREMVATAIYDDLLLLGGGTPKSLKSFVGTVKLKESNDPDVDPTLRRQFPKIEAKNLKLCRPTNPQGIPSLVIEFINPNSDKVGGLVYGYGAMSRVASFGSIE